MCVDEEERDRGTAATVSQIQGDCGEGSIDTAVGCIPFSNPEQFISSLYKWGIGIGGGVAFLLIIVAGFQIIISQGDPKKIQTGKELLTSVITGIVMLIFSVFILKFLGSDLLGIF